MLLYFNYWEILDFKLIQQFKEHPQVYIFFFLMIIKKKHFLTIRLNLSYGFIFMLTVFQFSDACEKVTQTVDLEPITWLIVSPIFKWFTFHSLSVKSLVICKVYLDFAKWKVSQSLANCKSLFWF